MGMTPVTAPADEMSALANLEEKILRVVAHLRSLQREKAILEQEKASLIAQMKTVAVHDDAIQREAAEMRKALEAARNDAHQSKITVHELEAARQEIVRLNDTVGRLGAERAQVRARIEKLLGQIELLSPEPGA
jgi:chromosome segregation ATPase